MLSTKVVSYPIVSNNTLFIALNGAAYTEGQQVPTLNPPEVLLSPHSPLIQVQIHLRAIQQIIKQYFTLSQGIFLSIKVNSLQIRNTYKAQFILAHFHPSD